MGNRETISGKFIIENFGKAELKLIALRGSCGCTTVRSDKSVLLPGAKAEIAFSVSLTNLRGPIEKQIIVETNDPVLPRHILSVRAHCPPWIKLQDESVTFERRREPDVATQLADFSTLRAAPPDSIKLLSQSDFVTAELIGSSVARDQKVLISLAPYAPSTPFSTTIRVSGPPQFRSFDINVLVTTKALVRCFPEEVLVVSHTGPLSACVKLSGYFGRAVRVGKVILPDAKMTASVVQDKDDSCHIDVSGIQDGAEEYIGDLTVVLNQPAPLTLHIPIRVVKAGIS